MKTSFYAAIAAVILFGLLGSVYIVREDQTALVLNLGRVARATGDATRFALLQEQYKSAPEVTRKRLWLETVQHVLSQNRKVVGGDGKQLIYVPMPAQNGAPAATAPTVLPSDAVMPAVESRAPSSTPNERPVRPTGREEPQR